MIAVSKQILGMPIHEAAPLIEKARWAQYEQPGGGIELLDAMARSATTIFSPHKPPSFPTSPVLPSVEESTDEAIEDYKRKEEGEKFPWGPKVPIGRK